MGLSVLVHNNYSNFRKGVALCPSGYKHVVAVVVPFSNFLGLDFTFINITVNLILVTIFFTSNQAARFDHFVIPRPILHESIIAKIYTIPNVLRVDSKLYFYRSSMKISLYLLKLPSSQCQCLPLLWLVPKFVQKYMVMFAVILCHQILISSEPLDD